jgi:hypothetical protein
LNIKTAAAAAMSSSTASHRLKPLPRCEDPLMPGRDLSTSDV